MVFLSREQRRGAFFFAFTLSFAAALVACNDSEDDSSARQSFLVVVEEGIRPQLQDRLDRYAEALRKEQVEVHVESFGPRPVAEFRTLLFQYVDSHEIEGALLVGALPTAWYEMQAFGMQAEFPFDIYLQDLDAIWGDADGDGKLDSHTDLELDIFTSRLTGTVERLQAYFDRVDRYRTLGPLVDVSAFVFIDDDWSETGASEVAPLRDAYGSVEVIQDTAESTLENYLARLTGRGAEFVYHKIMASPGVLMIQEPGEIARLSAQDIVDQNLEVSFVNLFSCYTTRFTEPSSVAEAYVTGTDYGLAAIGPTNKGAVRNSSRLHEHLAARMSWGEAYLRWFNDEGKNDDEWHLGIVLMGDPLLTLTGDVPP